MYLNMLRFALDIAGDELALATRMQVPLEMFRDWMSEAQPIPEAAFLVALAVVAGRARLLN